MLNSPRNFLTFLTPFSTRDHVTLVWSCNVLCELNGKVTLQVLKESIGVGLQMYGFV